MWSANLALLLLIVAVDGKTIEPVVRTGFGPLRGNWLTSERNISIASFLGVPYAQPPIGDLRFQSPRPWNEIWNKIRNATEDGSMCVQLDHDGNVLGNEDCLYLNVFVPWLSESIKSGSRLPVLVFVHGGSFNAGSNNSTLYGPDYLLDQEIILVTVNYRLGALGFFSTGDQVSPGNYGLKDILMALKWIQENVETFGGDPDSVTLCGHSSGAAAVHFLAMSNRSEGLFHRYIVQSGSGLAPWAFSTQENIRNKSLELAQLLNCTDGEENIEETVECMRSLDAVEIANASTFYRVWLDSPFVIFGPTLERESEDAILTKHPLRLLQEGHFRDLPWITGIVADEGRYKAQALFLNETLRDELLDDWDNLLPYYLNYEEAITSPRTFVDALTSFYFDGNVTKNFEAAFAKLVGDATITWPLYQTLKSQESVMNSSIYLYVLSYEGTFSSSFAYDSTKRYGVTHSDDLNYLFPYLNKMFADLMLHNTESDQTVIHIVTEMWANFAKNGIPRASLTTGWEPYQIEHRFARLGSERSTNVTMEAFPLERMQFWEELMNNVSVPIPEDMAEENEIDGKAVANGRVVRLTCSATLLASISLRVLAI